MPACAVIPTPDGSTGYPPTTRTWGITEETRQELQRRLDAGETTPLVPVPEAKRRTIAEEVETHLTAKRSLGLSPATVRKLKYQLGTFEQFLAADVTKGAKMTALIHCQFSTGHRNSGRALFPAGSTTRKRNPLSEKSNPLR